MTRLTQGLRLVGGLAISTLAVGALAHGGATGIVKERMDGMSAMAQVMKSLAPMMKGELDYDAAVVASGARTLTQHAGAAISTKFPAGSGGMPSEAAEDIWTDWDGFQALALQLETYALALELAAESEVGGPSDATANGGTLDETMHTLVQMPTSKLFGKIGKTCSACHKRFRIETK